MDTVRDDPLPFAMWPVGEQALLFHWLDAAVDQGTKRVELWVADRPFEVRQQVADASLWPIQIEVRSVPSVDRAAVDDSVNRLPKSPALTKIPEDGWSLIEHWFQLEQEWLVRFTEETKDYGNFAAIGKYCEIAADVQLHPPYWIGSCVSIGPGTSIGPGAVIEDGCILAGEHRIERAHVGAHTYLAPNTELVEACLRGNELLNFRHRAKVSGLEAFLAGGLQTAKGQTEVRPSLRDRCYALKLYLHWANKGFDSEAEFTDLQGRLRPVLPDFSPQARGPWLKQVVAGKMNLFGITPRPETTIRELPSEWQNILRQSAPGAFSYADVVGVHEVGSEEEVMHCIYQSAAPDGHCRELFDNWLLNLFEHT